MRRTTRIEIPRASQVVAARLRTMILRGELDDEARLPSAAEFAQQLGISGHHLREALRLLEQDGLVRIRRGHGGGISPAMPDPDVLARTFEGILARRGTLLNDLMAARLIIEPAAAQLAAHSATDGELDELERLLAQQEALPQYEAESNSEFHLAIVSAAHNHTLLLIMQSLQSLIQNVDSMSTSTLHQEAVRAHRSIVRALKARDADGVCQLMRRHLLGFETRLREIGVDSATHAIADSLRT